MNYICIGKIVNTHGIKGEVRILSDFLYKKEVFQPQRLFYIGRNKEIEKMKSYRIHKNYDMITFEDINDINEVLKYKGEYIYVNRDDLQINGYLNEDLMGMSVYSDRTLGKVQEILSSKAGRILVVVGTSKNMIPLVDEFIEEINQEQHYIKIKEIEGLIHED